MIMNLFLTHGQIFCLKKSRYILIASIDTDTKTVSIYRDMYRVSAHHYFCVDLKIYFYIIQHAEISSEESPL